MARKKKLKLLKVFDRYKILFLIISCLLLSYIFIFNRGEISGAVVGRPGGSAVSVLSGGFLILGVVFFTLAVVAFIRFITGG